MKMLLYVFAALIVACGVILIAVDLPFEADFPAAGPVAIGFGTLVLIAIFGLGQMKKT